MNKEDLHETLERLRCELGALGPESGPLKDRVNSLINDLEQQFQDLDNPGQRATMRDRLAKLIEQVESQHPSITSILDQIMTSLASMGV
jgi:regulator of replication initiation timing